MIAAIKEYISQIIILSLLITIVYQILPSKQYEKYIKLYVGMLFLFVIALPVMKATGVEQYFMEVYQEYETMMKPHVVGQGTQDQLYEKYEETLGNQVQAVLEKQGYPVEKVTVKTKKDGEIGQVQVMLQQTKGETLVKTIAIGEQNDRLQNEEIEALVKAMCQEQEIEVEVYG